MFRYSSVIVWSLDSSAISITSLQAGWPGNQDSVTNKGIEFLQSAQTNSGVHLASSPVGAWDLLLGVSWPWCKTDSCLPSSAEVNSVWSSTLTPTCLSTYFAAKLSVEINLHRSCNNFLLQSCTVIMLTYSDILCDTLTPNITVEWLPLLHMWENLRSNLRATIGWPLTFCCGFLQLHQANGAMTAQTSLQPLPWNNLSKWLFTMILLNPICYIPTASYFSLFHISAGKDNFRSSTCQIKGCLLSNPCNKINKGRYYHDAYIRDYQKLCVGISELQY